MIITEQKEWFERKRKGIVGVGKKLKVRKVKSSVSPFL